MCARVSLSLIITTKRSKWSHCYTTTAEVEQASTLLAPRTASNQLSHCARVRNARVCNSVDRAPPHLPLVPGVALMSVCVCIVERWQHKVKVCALSSYIVFVIDSLYSRDLFIRETLTRSPALTFAWPSASLAGVEPVVVSRLSSV